MIVIPAIDLKDGKCVRLYKGEFSKLEVVSDSPLNTAAAFQDEGAEFIHIVDLDGALKGEPANLSTIEEIIKNIKVPVEVGGGIRSLKTIDKLFKIGVNRIILGTAALKDKNIIYEAVKHYGNNIAVGIDVKGENVAVEAWRKISDTNYIAFAEEMENMGVGTLIITDISKDGTLKGPNLEMIEKVKKNTKLQIIASGGIKSIENIRALKAIDIYGVITGKAIYSGSLNLREAIKEGS